MTALRIVALLFFLTLPSGALAFTVEGIVNNNRHDAKGYSFAVTTMEGKNLQIVYGEDEPGQTCPLGKFFNTAQKLTPDEKVKVTLSAPARQATVNNPAVYYLCDDDSFLEVLP